MCPAGLAIMALIVAGATYSPSPSGRRRGEGQIEPGRARAGMTLPYAHVKSALEHETPLRGIRKLQTRRKAPDCVRRNFWPTSVSFPRLSSERPVMSAVR
jgi:hypothetical protein